MPHNVHRRSLLWFLLLASLLPLAAGCSSAPPFDARAVAMEWASYMQRDYPLRAGDKLLVRVEQMGQGEDNLQQVLVSPNGTVDLRLLPGPLHVAGKTVGAARTAIVEAYKVTYADPRVSVTLAEAAVQSVFVAGEVRRPGAVPYQPGMTLTQAVASAGSFDITIKESDVRVLRINPDGTQRTIRVNLSAVLYEEYPDFLLLPGDVIFCQTSGIADVGNWVELYIRRLLPFSLGGPALGTINN